ncbi:accessory gene regulator B family protein [Candidatus Stoquefichus sp. SB1]|uniref:accessory gene regulator B family protein n=1 Tax=Candidatus Stoquefichus sp. SB1 TaxID=1658109 RepID=UPI00067ED85D|nr:accessory gene regulator B family protein [Candidatus Stoquefichus sp. SB1]
MKKILSNISDLLIKKSNSNIYNKEIVEYGLQVLIFNSFTILTILFISYLFSDITFGFFFLITFGFLRITIGGFHAKTIYRCTLMMISIMLINLLLRNNQIYFTILKIFSIISILIFIYLHPSKKNTLSIKLKNFNLLTFFCFLIIYIITFNKNEIFIPIFSALLTVEILYFINKKNI